VKCISEDLSCLECTKEECNNCKSKILRNSKNYYASVKDQRKVYYANNREKLLVYAAEWREKNKERIKALRKEYYKKHKK
jgi:hypothetical protein